MPINPGSKIIMKADKSYQFYSSTVSTQSLLRPDLIPLKQEHLEMNLKKSVDLQRRSLNRDDLTDAE